jgi:hypothetical protein
MLANFDYYLLADFEEGMTKEAELRAEIPPVNPSVSHDIPKGFVYKAIVSRVIIDRWKNSPYLAGKKSSTSPYDFIPLQYPDSSPRTF